MHIFEVHLNESAWEKVDVLGWDKSYGSLEFWSRMCRFEIYGFKQNKINKGCPFDDTHGCSQSLWLSMKKNIIQIHNCRRYIWLLPQYVSTFYWKYGLVLSLNKLNTIQINISIKYIDMNFIAIRSHMGLFNFSPSYALGETKYKLNS